MDESKTPRDNGFEKMASEKRRGLVGETIDWLGSNKKWWLLPIVLAIVVLGILVVAASATGGTPFIYTIF